MTDASPAAKPGPQLYDLQDAENTCYLCRQPDYRLLHEVRHFGFPFRFKRCRCGLIKQIPMPNLEFFEWFFNSELFFSGRKHAGDKIWGFYDYFSDEPSRLATSRLRYRRLRSLFAPGERTRLLKIGPATGTFLHVAKQHGHRVLGCDVSSRLVDYARQTYGVEIHQGRFEKMEYPNRAFDVVMLFNVIENIPNQEEFLREVHRCLTPGGLFIFNFVDMKRNVLAAWQSDRYFLYRPPVCYAYDRDVMTKIMERFGFEVVSKLRDIRFLTLEKASTLLGWKWLLTLARILRIQHLRFPVWAYPSYVWAARGKESPTLR